MKAYFIPYKRGQTSYEGFVVEGIDDLYDRLSRKEVKLGLLKLYSGESKQSIDIVPNKVILRQE